MNSIINKAYVINLKERPDKWKTIQRDFAHTGLKLTRWNAVYGKKLSDKEYAEKTTALCNEFCSPGMVGCWLSHYNIWQNIVKNKENNVLILEDDAYPIKNFNYMFNKIWTEIPDDWDIVLLGCNGSCSRSLLHKIIAYDIMSKLIYGRKNMSVYKNNKIQKHIFRPSFPIATHAYMISYNGAKKLINNPLLKKVSYHIDNTLARYVYGDSSFKLYAFNPQIVFQNPNGYYSDVINDNHPLISYISSKIDNRKFKSQTLDSDLNTVVFQIRRLNITVTIFVIFLVIISFLVGLCGTNDISNYYIVGVIFIYIWEQIYKKKINNIMAFVFELVLAIIFVNIGRKLKNMLTVFC